MPNPDVRWLLNAALHLARALDQSTCTRDVLNEIDLVYSVKRRDPVTAMADLFVALEFISPGITKEMIDG